MSLAQAGDYLRFGVREIVYPRSLPLAKAELETMRSQLDEHGGVLRAALAFDELRRPGAVKHTLHLTM
jgi:hypothetical protein